MASNKTNKGNGNQGTVTDAGPIDGEALDQSMVGLDEWDDTEGEAIIAKRLFFKPLEAGEGAVLRGYPIGLVPITSTHDGRQVEGTGILIATTRPARLQGADQETKPYPAGTPAIIYCTDELQEVKLFAMGARVVEMAFRMGPRIKTNGGRTLQTMQFKRFAGSASRDEVKIATMSPALKRLAADTQLGSAPALGSGNSGGPNPSLPQ